ncbi:uncharacterized protein TNCV_991061 [Trichonephila clavipes]|nr:uncharacterized protein TNCV_991061 [Trichonephila clavipes]
MITCFAEENHDNWTDFSMSSLSRYAEQLMKLRYHLRHSDTSSFDSTNETLYEGKGSSNGPSRSNLVKSRSSRKPSSDESKSRKSNKGTAGLENLRLKRKAGDRKIQAPVLPQGIERTIPSSVSSRKHKYRRNNFNPSQGPQRQFQVNPINNRWGRTFQLKKRAGEEQNHSLTRPERPGQQVAKDSAAEGRPVRSGKTTTVRPCPYYLRSRFKELEGIPEEHRSTGIHSLPQKGIRRRSLRMEALDGDPADRSA